MTPNPSNHEQAAPATVAAEEAVIRLEDVQRITESALAYLDLDDLLAELLDRITDILRADTAAVLLVEEDGRMLAARAALARGGGGGFGCSDGEAAFTTACSVRPRRSLNELQDRVLGARCKLDHIANREFPPFRCLDLREILPTHLSWQRFIGALPEGCDKFLIHALVLSQCEP